MAVKNHSLDKLIIDAAKQEFLELGFRKATLRNIAKRANLTTGALYTRYLSKDELFENLIINNLKNVNLNNEDIQKLYKESFQEKDVNKFIKAIKMEEQLYLDFLFLNYDECLLLICKSDGSRIGKKLKLMMDKKASDTTLLFSKNNNKNVDSDGIKLLISKQFTYYKDLLNNGYDINKIENILKTISIFIEAGWKKIFEEII